MVTSQSRKGCNNGDDRIMWFHMENWQSIALSCCDHNWPMNGGLKTNVIMWRDINTRRHYIHIETLYIWHTKTKWKRMWKSPGNLIDWVRRFKWPICMCVCVCVYLYGICDETKMWFAQVSLSNEEMNTGWDRISAHWQLLDWIQTNIK